MVLPRLKTLLLLLFVVLQLPGYASTEDYQTLYEQKHRLFVREVTPLIRDKLSDVSREVQEIYKAIGYRPIWIDQDGLTHFAEMLLHEVKDDFNHGALKSLQGEYEKLLAHYRKFFQKPSNEERVSLELETMQLYVDHIHAILKGSGSGSTPLKLLQSSLEKGSLVNGFNAISKERIAKRTMALDVNQTILGEGVELDAKITEKLRKGSDKERLKEMYRLLDYKPIWVSEKGYSDYTNLLFEKIRTDRIFDHSGPTYREYERIKSLPMPKEKQEIVKREFEIAKLYQDFMGYLLYGAIDWKHFDRELHRRYKHGAWQIHNVLLSPELLLVESARAGTLEYAFKKMQPKYPGHERLADALVKYRKIAQAGG
ncbi:MAG: hypothetical protein B6D59_07480, partial [Campylobacteraceae bacterium 4484_4]